MLAAAICLAAAALVIGVRASNPSSGTLTMSSGPISYSAGPFLVANPSNLVNGQVGDSSDPTCGDEAHPCDDFTLTVDVPEGTDAAKLVRVEISWPQATADFDLYVRSITNNTEMQPAATASDPEVAYFPATSGQYRLRVVPFNPLGQSFTANISIVDRPPSGVPQLPQGTAPRFHNYASPLTMGGQSGEPSIGANWKTGRVLFQADKNTLRASFDDCTSPARVSWENKPAPTSVNDQDPILFTDRTTNRTIVSLLQAPGGAYTAQSASSVTDDDGETWIPSQGSGIVSGIDHQTIGGGPLAPPLTRDPKGPVYPNGVYYCAQDLLLANCALSLDGGLTYGPAVTIYSTECGGLHGHVKVAPDGTVYVPNKGCGSEQAVVRSDDNGVTWKIKAVPNSGSSDNDPSLGIGAGGTLYFGYVDGRTGHARIAVSHDKGDHWVNDSDVGVAHGIQNTVFPAVVAGDDTRAAYAFIGTPTADSTTEGNFQSGTFKGVWHLYVAYTYDSGDSWFTVDATPDDPVQIGGIWLQGGNVAWRNLLDFMDVTIDRQGRVLVGYADGCTGCKSASTSRSSLGTIARQSGGRGLIAKFDHAEPSVPKAPLVTVHKDSSGVQLSWPEPDNGGSAITGYKVYRGTLTGGYAAPVTVTNKSYNDTSADPNTTYFYRVTAVNSVGEGGACEVNSSDALPPPPPPQADSCDGVNVINDSTDDAINPAIGGAGSGDTQQVDIVNVSFSVNTAAKTLTTTMRLKNLSLMPINGTLNTYYYVVWKAPDGKTYATEVDEPDPTGEFSYWYGEFDTEGNQLKDYNVATGSFNAGPNGTITVTVPLSGVGNPTIPVAAGSGATPAVTEPYALTISGIGTAIQGALVYIQPNDRAPDNEGSFGANWAVCEIADPDPSPSPSPNASPSPSPSPSASPNVDTCHAPGTKVVTDPAGDQTGGQTQQNRQLDLISVSVAEPAAIDNSNTRVDKLQFTIKVADLSTIPINGIWRAFFIYTPPGGAAKTYHVSMLSDKNGNVTYIYGTVTTGVTTDGNADEGSYDPATGEIRILISNSKVGAPKAGETITVYGDSRISTGVVFAPADSTSQQPYKLVGSSACPAPSPQPTPPPQPNLGQDTPRFRNFNPSEGSGFGTDAGEPSIGANWKTGKIFFQSGLSTLRVSFNDSCPSLTTANWENKIAPTSQISFDPILYTDSTTGRTFVSQLLYPTTESAAAFTDNDGDLWTPIQGAGLTSGIDHQTLGGGPLHAPIPSGATYPNGVYYCAQDTLQLSGNGYANCALSLNGGLTFGPAVPIYAFEQCGGLHGHIKVAPDGTAYVPNKSCNGKNGVIYSVDNGVTWKVFANPFSTSGSSDPSVGIGDQGTVYFGYVNGDGHPHTAVLHTDADGKKSWSDDQDVGADLGLKNIAFPAMVAGDDDRAAFAFLGTTTAGDMTAVNFPGVWHLYVAYTFDGGKSWTTVNATPGDPVQRGGIWLGGGSQIHRNLLDFMDATIDEKGRVLVGYADGCTGSCVDAPVGATGNSYTALAAIARQSGGKGLFEEFDAEVNRVTAPALPTAKATRDTAGVVHLSWTEPDNGGSAITGYKVYRTINGQTTTLATLGANSRTYDDTSAPSGSNYLYLVTASNAIGESAACGSSATAVSPVKATDSCAAPGKVIASDRTGDQTGAPLTNNDLDIQWLSISEAATPDGKGKLVFTLKVKDLSAIQRNRQYRVFWNSAATASTGGIYYVGMTTDTNGAVSFEYGTAVVNVVVAVGVPVTSKAGAADTASKYAPDGTITIVVANDKVGNPKAGDLLGGIFARTFTLTGNTTTRSNTAIDTSFASAFSGTYRLAGNAACLAR
jgi:hypothetical protein